MVKTAIREGAAMTTGSVYKLIRDGKPVRRKDGSTIWCVDYKDAKGKRVAKSTFRSKKEADDWLANTKVDVKKGVHTPDRDSITVSEACDLWISHVDGLRERSTVKQYKEHAELHIKPRLGSIKLSQLARADVRGFETAMRKEASEAMAKKTLASLKALINVAMDNGKVAQNVALGVKAEASGRKGGEAQVEESEIPSKDEINAMLAFTKDHYPEQYPLLVTAAFTGMRPSEWRGLAWDQVDLENRVVRVSQRADGWGTIGETKTAKSVRNIPIGPNLYAVLAAWKLAQPMEERARGFVFPNGKGNPENIQNLSQRFLNPMQAGNPNAKEGTQLRKGAGIVIGKGKDRKHKFTWYSLRHFFASVLIDAGQDVVKVSRLLGHSTPTVTLNVYAHLFDKKVSRHDAATAMEAAILD